MRTDHQMLWYELSEPCSCQCQSEFRGQIIDSDDLQSNTLFFGLLQENAREAKVSLWFLW